MSVLRFLGEWALDAVESRYEVGDPPSAATYRIEGSESALAFHVDYDLGGVSMAFTYVTRPDGVPHAYQDPNGVVDRMQTTMVDDFSLETTSWREGVEIAHAVRTISPDGESMTITQSGRAPDGSPFTNVSVYRKLA